MTLTLPSIGLLAGFVLFVLASIPPLWHRSEQKPPMTALRVVCWVLAMVFVVLGLLPILGVI